MGGQSFRRIVDVLPASVAYVDRSYRYQYVNRSYVATFGTDPSGQRVHEFLPLELRDRIVDKLHAAMAGASQDFDVHAARPDGSRTWLHVHHAPDRDGSGQVVGIVALISDIDEHRLAQNRLDHTENRLHAILESAADAIIATDERGVIMSFNRAAETKFGYPAGDIIGSELWSLMPQECTARRYDSVADYLAACCDTTQGQEHESVGRRADGIRFPLAVRVSRMTASAGGFVVTMRNISARRAAEAAAEKLALRSRQTEKLEAIGTLAGGIAHDLNNSLAPILAYTYLLKDANLTERERDMVTAIDRATNRAKQLVERILLFGTGAGGERQHVHVSELVSDLLEFLRAVVPATIELEIDCPETSWAVLIDPVQLHQVLLNLCINAAQAMEWTGTLTIEIARKILRDGNRFGLAPGPYASMSIADTGPGIPNDVLPRIFDPFFTTKGPGEGSGLGLATVHRIIADHDGAVTVDSRLGEGATFLVHLPIAPAITETPRVHPPEVRPPELAAHVLLVDDEPALKRAVTRLLERVGCRVTAFDSSIASLAVFRASPTMFELAVLDQTMASPTGIELARDLLAIRPGLPIILCSGNLEADIQAAATKLGIRALLTKPFTAYQLFDAVSKATNGAARDDDSDPR